MTVIVKSPDHIIKVMILTRRPESLDVVSSSGVLVLTESLVVVLGQAILTITFLHVSTLVLCLFSLKQCYCVYFIQ